MGRMDREKRDENVGGGNGVFISEGVVKSIIPCDLFEKKEGNTMHYVVVVDVQKYESEETFEKKLLLTGKMWKKGQTPTHIANMMYALELESGKVPDSDIDAFLDENKISKAIAKQVVGKKIKFVDYRSSDTYDKDGVTKYSTKTWNGAQPFKTKDGKDWKAVDTFDVNTDNKKIYEAFMVTIEENNTYLKYQAEDDLATPQATQASPNGSEDVPFSSDEVFDI